MFKKIIILGLLSSSLFSANIPVDISNIVSIDKKWEINMNDGKTYYIMLPTTLSYDELKNSLKENDCVWVYRWYQTEKLVKADFGVNIVITVQVKKDGIKYWIDDLENGKGWQNFDTFDKLKTYVNDNILSLVDSNKQDIFLNSYLANFNSIYANKLYLVMPKGDNLSFSLAIKGIENNDSSTDSLKYPPSVPHL